MSEPKRAVQPRYLDGDALYRLRRDACLEQAELAERCQTTQQQISKWERGDYGCRLTMIRKLADALGCKPKDLMLADAPKEKARSPKGTRTPRARAEAA